MNKIEQVSSDGQIVTVIVTPLPLLDIEQEPQRQPDSKVHPPLERVDWSQATVVWRGGLEYQINLLSRETFWTIFGR